MQSPFDTAIYALSQDPNLTRIKKLLIYVGQSVWESDPYRLEYFDLHSLVRQVLQLAPARSQLRNRLDTFVRTLSKPDEYGKIADIIFLRLAPLCIEEPVLLRGGDRPDYHYAAQQLEQDPEQVRIKKLIYCACTQTWENDPDMLSQLNLEFLLHDLYRLTQTPEALATLLNAIIQTLNRQSHYIPLAQRIQDVLAPFYTHGAAPDIVEHTHVVPPGSSTRITAPAPPPEPFTPPLPPLPPPPVAADASSGNTAPVKVLDPSHLMDVRLQVMKYSNPLRAKVLLFAVLYKPLGIDHRSWDVLKTHDLAHLIQETYRGFKTYTDLRIKLQQVAQSLPDAEYYTQAAGAVLRALKPYYVPEAFVSPAEHGKIESQPEDHPSANTDEPATGVFGRREWTVPNLPPHP